MSERLRWKFTGTAATLYRDEGRMKDDTPILFLDVADATLRSYLIGDVQERVEQMDAELRKGERDHG